MWFRHRPVRAAQSSQSGEDYKVSERLENALIFCNPRSKHVHALCNY